MVRTVFIQLILFLLPFLGYAIYRLLLTDAETDGRKTWPINALFLSGAVLTVAGWLYMVMSENSGRDVCFEPAQVVDGEMIPARSVPCDRGDLRVGVPANDLSPVLEDPDSEIDDGGG